MYPGGILWRAPIVGQIKNVSHVLPHDLIFLGTGFAQYSYSFEPFLELVVNPKTTPVFSTFVEQVQNSSCLPGQIHSLKKWISCPREMALQPIKMTQNDNEKNGEMGQFPHSLSFKMNFSNVFNIWNEYPVPQKTSLWLIKMAHNDNEKRGKIPRFPQPRSHNSIARWLATSCIMLVRIYVMLSSQ